MKTTNRLQINLFWITLFSIAMGYLECVVVVYLRAIYSPDGFNFSLSAISEMHANIEIGRELATIIMLVGVGIITGKNNWEKFAVFIYSFAVWDLFYYFFLKILLDWPESILTWDLLFLIPTVWSGPVLAPVISASSMIILALIIIFNKIGEKNMIRVKEKVLLISGALVQIIAYTWDYSIYLHKNGMLCYFFMLNRKNEILEYVPDKFPWILFFIGEMVIIYVFWLIVKKARIVY